MNVMKGVDYYVVWELRSYSAITISKSSGADNVCIWGLADGIYVSICGLSGTCALYEFNGCAHYGRGQLLRNVLYCLPLRLDIRHGWSENP
jgi:hypothetical protein